MIPLQLESEYLKNTYNRGFINWWLDTYGDLSKHNHCKESNLPITHILMIQPAMSNTISSYV